MNLLVDIGHPAHVHLFRNLAKILISEGHNVLFTCRDKEVTINLLQHYKLDYVSLGKPFSGVIGKLTGLIIFDIKLFNVARKFKPDLFISHGSFYAAHAAALLGKPHIALEDTGNMEQVKLYLPFSKAVLTSDVFHKELGPKQIKYPSFHELAYLHPNSFTADKNINEYLNLPSERKYILLRLVSWNATHDIGHSGLTPETITSIINHCKDDYEIFISSEAALPDEFIKYKIKIDPYKILDVMAGAELFIGEGATMASECAMIGTPAIYVNTLDAGTLREQEKYGLIFSFRNSNGVFEKVKELLSDTELKNKTAIGCKNLLNTRIDLTKLLYIIVKEYPKSLTDVRKGKVFFERCK